MILIEDDDGEGEGPGAEGEQVITRDDVDSRGLDVDDDGSSGDRMALQLDGLEVGVTGRAGPSLVKERLDIEEFDE